VRLEHTLQRASSWDRPPDLGVITASQPDGGLTADRRVGDANERFHEPSRRTRGGPRTTLS
jgi:hypothetical protein